MSATARTLTASVGLVSPVRGVDPREVELLEGVRGAGGFQPVEIRIQRGPPGLVCGQPATTSAWNELERVGPVTYDLSGPIDFEPQFMLAAPWDSEAEL